MFYSSETEEAIINTLQKRYDINHDLGQELVKRIGFASDSSSLSTKACKKLIPELKAGVQYEEAVTNAGYQHKARTKEELLDRLDLIKSNSLRNPVVEQILNQTINIVNALMDKYGRFDSIHVEMARELRNSSKQRAKISKAINKRTKERNNIKLLLQKELSPKVVSRRDIDKYLLIDIPS